MKKILLVFFLLTGYVNYAQVGIGTEMPDPSAQLDIVVPLGDKGVLLPRLALLSTTDMTTITNGNVESLLVYNTATQNDVTPGFYYWYDGSWRRLGVLGDNAETITTLVNNGNGTYTYTSEDGTLTTFTAGGVMVDNGNGSYTYTNPDGTVVNLEGVAETLTVLNYDNTTGIITYTDEDGGVTTIDISAAVANWETLTSIALNPDNTHIDYTDEEGNVTQLNLTALVQNLETLTTIVANADGTFTYTDESGNATVVNIGDLETLTFLSLNPDGKTLEYTDESGDLTAIDLGVIISTFETITTLVDNGNGTYTYTNENGDVTQIDLSNTETLTSIALNPDNTHIDYTDEEGNVTQLNLTALVQNLETLTTIVANADGTFTYTDESGNATVVNIGDLETLTFLSLNPDGKTLEYTDESGGLTAIDLGVVIATFETITTLVDNGNGTYTYTNENGDVTQIDVSSTETLTAIALNPDNTHIDYTDEEGNVTQLNLTALVQNLETLTTIVANADGTFTYTDESGNATVVNIGDLETLTSLVLSPNTNTLIYTDESGNENSIDLTAMLLDNQLTVTLVDGENTTVSATVNGNNTEWQVNVPVATGATDTTPSTLGVVKEADTNPTVTIDEQGALAVNMEAINDIKEITGTYSALPTDAVLLGNASDADVTIILPSPEDYKGKKITIKKQDANEDHYVNVFGNISGLTQLYTALPYSGWELISDGSQWKITNKF